MALNLITNPVGPTAATLFAGFEPVEFVFKREDLAITGVESGSGGLRVNLTTDLTSYLSVGDSIYVYSEGAAHTYDDVGVILSLTATDITTDIAYVQDGTGGYINYKKNYYVEMQCVDKQFASSNLVPFSLNSDGDSAGNINIDVSLINDLNRQRGLIADGHIDESSQEFEVQYREVYEGSSNSFTLIDNKLIVLLYATETPEMEVILNGFDTPKIYLGYSAALVIAKTEDASGSTIEIKYQEFDINSLEVDNDVLSTVDSDVNGFLMWKWSADASISEATKFIKFSFDSNFLAEYDNTEYSNTEYVTD